MKHERITLDAPALGIAAGVVAAILTTVCAIAIVLAPAATTSVAGTLLHLDLSDIARTMSWGVYLGGLAGWTIGVGLVFTAAAGLYNRLTREESRATAD